MFRNNSEIAYVPARPQSGNQYLKKNSSADENNKPTPDTDSKKPVADSVAVGQAFFAQPRVFDSVLGEPLGQEHQSLK